MITTSTKKVSMATYFKIDLIIGLHVFMFITRMSNFLSIRYYLLLDP